jgi:ATP-dependent HslUV protease ATP-binding subunit HslU
MNITTPNNDTPEISLDKPNSPLSLTPKEIVASLDRFIIGQANAKRSVAIAMRNRWRRLVAPDDIRDEITPKNIIMIGPTGVGKTEIARRLAKLTNSPFVKVEASKFTEVGYVGRDVESMIRDLMDQAYNMVKSEQMEANRAIAKEAAINKLIDILIADYPGRNAATRTKIKNLILAGKLANDEVEISIESQTPKPPIMASLGLDELDKNLQETFSQFLPKKRHRRTVKVPQALEL